MGKLVTFWSPYKGKAKVTSSMCAIAGAFGMEYPELSIALSHTKANTMELEEKLYGCLRQEQKQELFGKTGTAALKLHYRQAVLTSEKIRRSAIPLAMKSLFLYPCTEEPLDNLSFHLITEELKVEFDVVFLDVESGREDESVRFLQAADFVVIVLPQDPQLIKLFLDNKAEYLEGKQYCILLGGYMENSKFSRTFYIRKKILKEEKELVGVIPMNAGFFDAMSEGKSLDYFFRNQKVRKREENYGFMDQTKKAAEYIRRNLFLSGVERKDS